MINLLIVIVLCHHRSLMILRIIKSWKLRIGAISHRSDLIMVLISKDRYKMKIWQFGILASWIIYLITSSRSCLVLILRIYILECGSQHSRGTLRIWIYTRLTIFILVHRSIGTWYRVSIMNNLRKLPSSCILRLLLAVQNFCDIRLSWYHLSCWRSMVSLLISVCRKRVKSSWHFLMVTTLALIWDTIVPSL